MNKNELSFAAKDARRNRAYELNLAGYTYQQISKKLEDEGLGKWSVTTVSKIIHQLSEKILGMLKDKTESIKVVEYQRLEKIHQKLWEGYLLTNYIIEEQEIKLKNGKTKLVQKKKKVPGDVRFLLGAVQAADRRIKLWGLDTPQKVDMRVTNASVDLNQAIDQFRNLQEEMRNWEKSRLEEGSKQLTIIPEAEIISVPIEGENQNEKRSNDVES